MFFCCTLVQAAKNRRLILVYLIPCRLRLGSYPSRGWGWSWERFSWTVAVVLFDEGWTKFLKIFLNWLQVVDQYNPPTFFFTLQTGIVGWKNWVFAVFFSSQFGQNIFSFSYHTPPKTSQKSLAPENCWEPKMTPFPFDRSIGAKRASEAPTFVATEKKWRKKWKKTTSFPRKLLWGPKKGFG